MLWVIVEDRVDPGYGIGVNCSPIPAIVDSLINDSLSP